MIGEAVEFVLTAIKEFQDSVKEEGPLEFEIKRKSHEVDETIDQNFIMTPECTWKIIGDTLVLITDESNEDDKINYHHAILLDDIITIHSEV